MDQQTKDIINEKIQDLQQLATDNATPMLLFFVESDEPGGQHLAAYGDGYQIKQMVVNAANHNGALR